MDASEFLLWVRGPAFTGAAVIFAIGVTLRLLEVLGLGRPRDLAPPNVKNGSGWRTIATRSVPDRSSFQRGSFTYVTGYIFHIGLFITLFFFAAHIELFRALWGFGWPSLPTTLVDATAVATIATLLLVLINRIVNPVKRFLSTPADYLVWTVTFLPLLTGYFAFHHLALPYNWMLGVHILTVELLLVVFPFTKLMHTFTLFLSRWYNGEAFAKKGVRS